MEYYAHTDENGNRQLLYDHLKQVADYAAEFGASFQASAPAERIGLAHDIGKISEKFQRRLTDESIRVDHSTAGAVELFKHKDYIGALCVAGHHAGLPDLGTYGVDSSEGSTLGGRIRRAEEGKLEDYSAFNKVINLDRIAVDYPKLSLEETYFYSKMLFSCLVDADFLDTERFMTGRVRKTCGAASMEELRERLNKYIKQWEAPENELNKIRCRVLHECIDAGKAQKGLYSLTVPTGGGKTVSSLAFALNQANENQMQRIIYVIPYTTIIDQCVSQFENILGAENVLAHYSEADYSDGNDDDEAKKLATENWDMPVVVTTAVQFFESIYANRVSKSRKLHNIANSVIVFDEYQTLPVKHMKPCTEAIYQLVNQFGCTVLLCTATQPGTERFFHGMDCKEVVSEPKELFEKLRRVTYRKKGKISLEALSQCLQEEEQVLCVVNTRKTAQRIYQEMNGDHVYHLSTLMVPKHRKEVLEKVKRILKAPHRESCRVVSTSLIEAGIDVDFPTVYREINGLDSIIQAAGRCNREGKRAVDESAVWIFETDGAFPRMQRGNRDAMKETMELGYDMHDPEATEKYFSILFDLKGERALDQENIMEMISRGGPNGILPFKTIAGKFHMIDNETRSIYIPYDEQGAELTRRLAKGERTTELFRQLGAYCVNLYPQEYEKLESFVVAYDESAVVLSDMRLYSLDTGLMVPDMEDGEGFFI